MMLSAKMIRDLYEKGTMEGLPEDCVVTEFYDHSELYPIKEIDETYACLACCLETDLEKTKEGKTAFRLVFLS